MEFSVRHHEVVLPENDILVRTNHYKTEAMKQFEVAPHPWQQNSQGRHIQKPFRRTELFDVSPEFVVGTALSRYRTT